MGGTGSGSALNQLAEETHYHLFDSPLGRLPSQVRVPASAGSLKDDRGMRETAAAGPERPAPPCEWTQQSGIVSAMLAVIGRRLYFSLGTLVKAFLTLKSSGAVPSPSRDSYGEKELLHVLKLGMARRGRKGFTAVLAHLE
jgi:hypothetical protein